MINNEDQFWIFKSKIKPMKAHYACLNKLIQFFGHIHSSHAYRQKWGVVMVQVIILLSPTMTWTRTILCKQRLTADQRISQRGDESKRYFMAYLYNVSTIEAIRQLWQLTIKTVYKYILRRQSEWETSACQRHRVGLKLW